MGDQTVVAVVADELARRVAAGEYAPGERMASVRTVAWEFGMTRATAQLALGRLESYGFVEGHPGNGFIVRDVYEEGGLQVYGRLFELSMPNTAIEMFRSIIDCAEAIVLDALIGYTESERRVGPAELTAVIDELEALARADDPDRRRMLVAELSVVRKLLTALGHTMQRAMLNSIGAVVLAVPQAVESLYPAPLDLRVHVWRLLVAAWESDTRVSEAQLTLFADVLQAHLKNVVARFEELVGAEPERHIATA